MDCCALNMAITNPQLGVGNNNAEEKRSHARAWCPVLMGNKKGTVIRKSTYLLSCLQQKEGVSERLLCLRLREQLIRLAAILAFIYKMYSISASVRHLKVSDKMISIKGARTVALVVHVSIREKSEMCMLCISSDLLQMDCELNIWRCTHWQILSAAPSPQGHS